MIFYLFINLLYERLYIIPHMARSFRRSKPSRQTNGALSKPSQSHTCRGRGGKQNERHQVMSWCNAGRVEALTPDSAYLQVDLLAGCIKKEEDDYYDSVSSNWCLSSDQ